MTVSTRYVTWWTCFILVLATCWGDKAKWKCDPRQKKFSDMDANFHILCDGYSGGHGQVFHEDYLKKYIKKRNFARLWKRLSNERLQSTQRQIGAPQDTIFLLNRWKAALWLLHKIAHFYFSTGHCHTKLRYFCETKTETLRLLVFVVDDWQGVHPLEIIKSNDRKTTVRVLHNTAVVLEVVNCRSRSSKVT